MVYVCFTEKLQETGEVFYSTSGNQPVTFLLGAGHVIDGLDVGIDGMRVGGKGKLTVPPAMGYGARGLYGKIPPDTWLVYDVKLINVK